MQTEPQLAAEKDQGAKAAPISRRAIILLLGTLAAIGPFSIDTYLPAFPSIAVSLHSTVPQVGLSLASYFVGICVGQIGYGPILDRFGRKRPLLWSLGLYALASLGCGLSTSVGLLVFWRFVQALGGCAGMVASRALVRDLFPREAAKIFSSLMLVMGVAPIIAPSLGGWMNSALSWRAIFVFMLLFSSGLILAVGRYLPSDSRNDTRYSLRPWQVVKGYFQIFREKDFLAYGLSGSLGMSGMFAYISGSPFVYMKLFGLTETQFSWAFGINAAALVTGSQLNRYLLAKASSEKLTRMIGIMQLIAAGGMALAVATVGLGAWGVFSLVWLYLFFQGLFNPNATALSLRPFPKKAGSAAALAGSIQMAFSALVSACESTFHDNTARPMTFAMAACSVLALLLLLGFASRYDRPIPTQEA